MYVCVVNFASALAALRRKVGVGGAETAHGQYSTRLASLKCIAVMAEASSVVVSAPSPSEVLDTAMTDRPTCIICLGMAGSGKTTFVQVQAVP